MNEIGKSDAPVATSPVYPAAPASARDQLRELCVEHYHGLLTREVYRQRRAALLDAVVLGRPRPGPAQPQQPAAGAASENTVRRVAVPPVAQPAEPRPPAADLPARAAKLPAPALAAAGLIVLLVGGWLLFRPDGAPAPDPVAGGVAPAPGGGVTGAPSVSLERAKPGAPRAPEAFVERFLAGPGGWNDVNAVADFDFEWRALGPDEQRSLQATPSFQRFSTELRERILDERALGVSRANQGLEGFATGLGLDLGLPPLPAAPMASATAAASDTAPPEAEIAGDSAEPPGPEPVPPATPATSPTRPVAVSATGRGAGSAAAAKPTPAPSSVTDPVAAASPSPAAAGKPCVAALAQRPKAQRTCWDLLPDGSRGPTLVVVGPGEFSMGSRDDPGARPPVTVQISSAFALGQSEVSQAQFAAYCRAAGRPCPSSPWEGADLPVVNITWQDAVDYARWLSQQTGQRYRLPSEAEWEFAARGGTTTRYPSGDQVSGLIHTKAQAPVPATRFPDNPFGFIHTLGNVREWVGDGWSPEHTGASATGIARRPEGSLRVVRGGSFRDADTKVRSSSREPLDAGKADDQTGFRVLRELGSRS